MEMNFTKGTWLFSKLLELEELVEWKNLLFLL